MIKQYYLHIILVLCLIALGFLTFAYIGQSKELSSLKKSEESLTRSLTDQIATNEALINEINETDLKRTLERETASHHITALEKVIDSLSKKRYDPEIDTLPPAELERLFHSTFPGI